MKEYSGTFKVTAYVEFSVEAENEEEAINKLYKEYDNMGIKKVRDTDGEMIKLECLGIAEG